MIVFVRHWDFLQEEKLFPGGREQRDWQNLDNVLLKNMLLLHDHILLKTRRKWDYGRLKMVYSYVMFQGPQVASLKIFVGVLLSRADLHFHNWCMEWSDKEGDEAWMMYLESQSNLSLIHSNNTPARGGSWESGSLSLAWVRDPGVESTHLLVKSNRVNTVSMMLGLLDQGLIIGSSMP